MKSKTKGNEARESYSFGSLTADQAQLYFNLIDEGKLDCEPGGEADVYFCGDTAIRTARDNSIESAAKVVWNDVVLRYLGANGVQVVNSHGSYIAEDGRSMSTMDTRDWRLYHELNGKEQASARRQFREQISRIEELGFEPRDITLEDNCQYHRKTGRLEIFDAGDYIFRVGGRN